MGQQYEGQSIDTMPLSMFYTEGICLDFSHKGLKELIEPIEIENACKKDNLEIKKGDTVLIYTDHNRKHFNGIDWGNGPGISAKTTRWLGEKKSLRLALKQCLLVFRKYRIKKYIIFVES